MDAGGIRYMTVEEMNARSRARYDSLDQMFGPNRDGKGAWVWRFADDPEWTWRLNWNDTRLKREG